MNIALVGCGKIGARRASCLGRHSLRVVADAVHERALDVAGGRPDVIIVNNWSEAVGRPEVDMVIVSTTHDMLAAVSLAAVEAGKHVLVEKPGARRASELVPVIEAARRRNVRVKVGFNHRFHPALLKAKEYVENGAIGDLMFIRGRYGHGGRLGYEKEWRANPVVSGGGNCWIRGCT